MNIFQILLASNSDAEKNMTEARERLRRVFPLDIRFSKNVESKAVNKEGKIAPDASMYLNAICLANTGLPLDSVQSILKAMEVEMGRKKGNAFGLVVIDLDLVVWNGEILRPWDVAQSYYQECFSNSFLDRNEQGSGIL